MRVDSATKLHFSSCLDCWLLHVIIDGCIRLMFGPLRYEFTLCVSGVGPGFVYFYTQSYTCISTVYHLYILVLSLRVGIRVSVCSRIDLSYVYHETKHMWGHICAG